MMKRSSAVSLSDLQPPAIECEDVWKIYSTGAAAALHGIKAAGLDKRAALERFGAVVAVAGVSFTVRAGEIMCIMGLSGSGKSTLLRHINRLIEPTAGVIRIWGRDIGALDKRELAVMRSSKISMVFQHVALFPHRTVRDNVSFGLEVQGIDRRARAAAAERALATVDLSEWQEAYPDELSGGMQQRVGLARALAADPDILLMDEPFSALDPIIRSDLQNQFLRLTKAINKTTVFITHDLEEAVKLGHRVAIMKDGEIVQIGSPAEILGQPKNEYVARFVNGISRLRHVTASDLIEVDDATRLPNFGRLEPCPHVLTNADIDLLTTLDHLLRGSGRIAVRRSDGYTGCVTLKSAVHAIRNFLA